MSANDFRSSEAAEVVLQERQRQKELDNRRRAKESTSDELQQPVLETVSVPKWEGADAGEVDESELDRRQRVISEQLEKKQREVHRQGQQLARVRAELKALEQPIKEEIMQLREKLEESNRQEKALVESVNALRKDLHGKEKSLKEVREGKQQLADNLIKVMADYERRKTERLNEIADLVGGQRVTKSSSKSSNFAGF